MRRTPASARLSTRCVATLVMIPKYSAALSGKSTADRGLQQLLPGLKDFPLCEFPRTAQNMESDHGRIALERFDRPEPGLDPGQAVRRRAQPAHLPASDPRQVPLAFEAA